jgi:hypothetical protein
MTRRYTDNPKVKIDPAKVPPEFRHLLPLAKEWSIGDDVELEAYIAAASEEKKKELVAAFSPHFDGLWKWHQACERIVPQPDELVLFDAASNAAATVHSMLS